MATYYRWEKSAVKYIADIGKSLHSVDIGRSPSGEVGTLYWSNEVSASKTGVKLTGDIKSAKFENTFGFDVSKWLDEIIGTDGSYYYSLSNDKEDDVVYGSAGNLYISEAFSGTGIVQITVVNGSIGVHDVKSVAKPDEFISYVYSTNPSTYPTDGAFGDFYYDNRTTVTSPTTPTGMTNPNPITTNMVSVGWNPSSSETEYPISLYELSYSTNGGGSWTIIGTTAETSMDVNIPTAITSIMFRVRANDTNNQWSDYLTSGSIQVVFAPKMIVPSIAMQGNDITVNWTAVTGATSYTIQRKANTDQDWVQIYSGAALTFTETAGSWTSVEYRAQSVFNGVASGWGTSKVIPVVSASALVISGQDEDLGLITHDVPYTVSTDTGNPISLTRTVNGVQVASMTVENGFAYDIPVMDLPTGEGTIVLSASVNTSGGSPVTATRTWAYTKTACIFPNVGSTAQLTLQGENIFPPTLAECVRVGANLGGDLGHALEMLTPLVLNGAQMYTDSYIGTGTYGQSNPTEITFPFLPDFWWIICQKNSSGVTTILDEGGPYPWNTETIWNEEGVSGNSTVTYNSTTIQIVSQASAAAQRNNSGSTYYFVGIKIG